MRVLLILIALVLGVLAGTYKLQIYAGGRGTEDDKYSASAYGAGG